MEKFLKLLKSRTWKNIVYYCANAIMRVVYMFFLLQPVKKNKLVVFNYNGKGYGDNPKYVVQQLIKNGKPVDIVWMTKESCILPDGVRGTKMYSLKGFFECATASVWISNARLPLYLVKKNSQLYLQLWHGGCGPKKVEKAVEDKLIRWYISSAKHDSKMANFFVSNSCFNDKLIQRDYWYGGEILPYGSPRHDVFFKNQEVCHKRVCKTFNIPDDVHILLYAPTFRDNKKLDLYCWDYEAVRRTAELQFGGEWIFVVRLHPNISFLDDGLKYSEQIVNGSRYDDMQELISACDIMITDFSGVMMQGAIAHKKVFLLVPDKNQYQQQRGLCIDIDNTPFPQAENAYDLCAEIQQMDDALYEHTLTDFLKGFGFYDDGQASERVCTKILDWMGL